MQKLKEAKEKKSPRAIIPPRLVKKPQSLKQQRSGMASEAKWGVKRQQELHITVRVAHPTKNNQK